MDPKKVEAVLAWPVPKTRREVQSFLGFSNFYRRFIRNFSQEVRPLTALTRLGTKFMWTEAAQRAFERLKDRFTSAPILALPNAKLPFVLEVDASDSAAGAILSQREGLGEHLHPVAFFSKVFSSAERNYDVSDRELLAVKLALEEWRHLLEGAAHPVTVMTDHKNLEYLQRARRLKARQARWSIFFTRFDLHFTYRPGSKNGKADALSRLHQESIGPSSEPETILPARCFLGASTTLWDEIRDSTQRVPVSETLPTMTKNQGYLLHQGRVVVPREVVPSVLQLCHDSPLAGHGGVRRTTHLVRRTFWWQGMDKDIHAYVSACPVCARSKDPRSRAQGLLQPLSVPSRAWAEVAMDFIVELPRSRGFDTVLVVVDRLTKMAHFVALPGLPSAKQTAEVLIREVVRLHGVPEAITTDRGSQFTSRFWGALCQNLGIHRRLSSAFHPRTNGQTERTNQTLEQYLRCYIAQVQDTWSEFLPLAEFAYNNHVHQSTGVTPFYANYGQHPAMLPSSPIPCAIPGVEELVQKMAEETQVLKKNLLRAQESYKRHFDLRHAPAPKYQVGDRVWLSTAHIRLALPSKKLGPRFIGPYAILKVISPTAMRLKLPASFRIHPVFHVSLLRAVVPDTYPDRGLPPVPGPVIVEGEEEFEVQAIVDSRLHYGKLQYLVAWKGYGPEENSWVPTSEVHAPDLVRAFHQANPLKPSQSVRRPGRGRPCSVPSGSSPAVSDPGIGGSPSSVVDSVPPGPSPCPVVTSPGPLAPSPSVPGRPRRGRPPQTLVNPVVPALPPGPACPRRGRPRRS